MSIDVIIPLYNGAPWIKESIDGILVQELPPKEIIVVDDGSTDGSPDLVRNYPEVKLVRNTGKGSSVARNVGMMESSSPFVAFLDQDDVWHPAHLRLLTQAFQKHPEANTVFATADAFDQGLPNYRVDTFQITPYDPWSRFPFTIGVDGPSLSLIRRSTLIDIGMWEERSTGMGDALLYLKLSALHPLMKLSCCTVGKRVHPGSQWLKVRDWGASYLDFRIQVMHSALDFRRKQSPSNQSISTYERRLDALKTLRKLSAVISNDDLEKVPLLGHQLERELSTDPQEYLPHAFYCLMGALFPINDSERLRIERDRVFSKLLEFWPEEALRTRSAISGMIGETPLVS